MKTVCKENNCVGCMACIDVCPKAAISIVDSLEAYNAVINSELCIHCDACHRICQNNNEPVFSDSISWYEGWSTMNRERSSSGGAAAEIVSAFIKRGGVVCSCAFQEGRFGFFFAPNELPAEKFIGSKYVKSNPEGIYKRIKDLLKNGINVLFLGLPCQVEAVKEFVGEKYQDNLYTVDLICHGSPSPKLLDMFLQDYGLTLNEIENITFRNKSTFKLKSSVKEIEPTGVRDAYTFAFLNCLDYTENCYNCRYARKERVSDITLGDSWGSVLPKDEQKKGISLILCQTRKGEQLVQSAKITLLPVDYEKALESNHQLRHPSVAPECKDKFFERISSGKRFKSAVAAYYPKFYVKQSVKKVLIKCGIFGGGAYE